MRSTLQFNRRMDEWITKDKVERIDVEGSSASAPWCSAAAPQRRSWLTLMLRAAEEVHRKNEKEKFEAEKRAVEQASRKRVRKDDLVEMIEEEHGENDGMDEASCVSSRPLRSGLDCR